MRVLVSTDSYKGSLSTFEAANAIREGILLADKNAKVDICPLADGGEGTLETIVSANNGKIHTVNVTGPLGEMVSAQYGVVNDIAIIEMASAAGITLVPDEKRNPLHTTTYGVGELIREAINNGCRKFIVGIGGSATNDGGIGMLQALGVDFLDSKGCAVSYGAKGLEDLAVINANNMMPELKRCTFEIACDVTNPLCGENGCSAIYGPQKGATTEMIKNMDSWLENYARLTAKETNKEAKDCKGAGAAGGIGFAFISYLGGTLKSGIDLVIEATGLEEKIKTCDVVVTGEGRLDAQTCMGKAPIGVARLAKKYGKIVIAFAGSVSDTARACNENGIDAYFSITDSPCMIEHAMNSQIAYKNLKNTSEQAFRLAKIFENQNT
jgi:glycerate kinase